MTPVSLSRTHAPARGVTLLELLVVIALVGIMTSIAGPNLSRVGTRSVLRTAAEQVAAGILQARSAAIADGRCYAVAADSNARNLMFAAPFPTLNCEGTVTVAGHIFTIDGISVTGGNLRVANVPLVTIEAKEATELNLGEMSVLNSGAGGNLVVWRPSGWMRGANWGNAGTINVGKSAMWTAVLLSRRLPNTENRSFVRITPVGLACVGYKGDQPCP